LKIKSRTLQKLSGEPDEKLFDNYVFSELAKMGIRPKYWKSKAKT